VHNLSGAEAQSTLAANVFQYAHGKQPLAFFVLFGGTEILMKLFFQR
jgi:hypothetical protein